MYAKMPFRFLPTSAVVWKNVWRSDLLDHPPSEAVSVTIAREGMDEGLEEDVLAVGIRHQGQEAIFVKDGPIENIGNVHVRADA